LRKQADPLLLIVIDAAGMPTLTDLCVSFVFVTGKVLSMFIATAQRNGRSVLMWVVDEDSGVLIEQETTADLPANTQFLSPRLFKQWGNGSSGRS
jgi:hypothetical protein